MVVRHALRQADIDDQDLADYLAAMLLDFGRRDRAWRVDGTTTSGTAISWTF